MTRLQPEAPALVVILPDKFLSKPYSLFYAAAFLLVVAVTSSYTGLPWIFFLFFALFLGF